MIPILNKLVSLFQRYYKILAVFIILILAAFLFYTYNLLQKRTAELDQAVNNYEYYEQLATKGVEQNRTLQLTIDQFKSSNDSLINKIRDVQKELKIKDNSLKTVTYVEEVIKHDTTVIVNDKDFDVVIKPNELTTIEIIKKDSLLNHKLDIQNDQALFITSKKVYRKEYKNWFRRLLHFDFKKRLVYEYQINNTNDLIRVQNTRIIELSK